MFRRLSELLMQITRTASRVRRVFLSTRVWAHSADVSKPAAAFAGFVKYGRLVPDSPVGVTVAINSIAAQCV
jgi:hypothetical protein